MTAEEESFHSYVLKTFPNLLIYENKYIGKREREPILTNYEL